MKYKNRVGETHKTNKGDLCTIIEYINYANCTVKFEDGTIVDKRQYHKVKNGSVDNPYRPSVFGIGYMGVGEYKSRINNEQLKTYSCWRSMMERGYSNKYKKKYPTYKDVTVCEEWHNFQNFAKWHEENYNPETMKGWELDKDILVKGNKIYSPETCCFVPKEINYLLTKSDSIRGELPIGVKKSGNKFQSRVLKNRISHSLGTYKTSEEAFQVYKEVKEKYIKEVADKWKGKISDRVYQAMYNYTVEITD